MLLLGPEHRRGRRAARLTGDVLPDGWLQRQCRHGFPTILNVCFAAWVFRGTAMTPAMPEAHGMAVHHKAMGMHHEPMTMHRAARTHDDDERAGHRFASPGSGTPRRRLLERDQAAI